MGTTPSVEDRGHGPGPDDRWTFDDANGRFCVLRWTDTRPQSLGDTVDAETAAADAV